MTGISIALSMTTRLATAPLESHLTINDGSLPMDHPYPRFWSKILFDSPIKKKLDTDLELVHLLLLAAKVKLRRLVILSRS